MGVALYAAFFCWRNRARRAAWREWTAHLSGPPPWALPSNDLQRFRSDTLIKGDNGLMIALWGYVDSIGNVVIEPRFSACGRHFYDDLAWASSALERKSGYIRPDGSWAIVVTGTTHSDITGGMGEVQVIGSDGYPMYGFVSAAGAEVVPPVYHRAEPYVDGYVLVEARTLIGKWIYRIGRDVGAAPRSGLDTEVIFLDTRGRRTSLPRR